ncbi:MAG: alcohol dehydrogenase catalytic domain-containing protein [Bacillota bacterium]|nr:alcohol dehydrogenase catalytic domain-containing protein [Bacillota bacterium]
MRALVYAKNPKLQNVPEPQRLPGQALIRVELAGICNTDIEITQGYSNYRGILGHEFVGKVVESDDLHLVDKRVVGSIDVPCGGCKFCRMNMPNYCSNRMTMGMDRWQGCLADYVVLPEVNLTVVPDNVPSMVAAFAEPVSSALQILELATIGQEDSVIVLGDGKLGLLTAQVLKVRDVDVTVLGKHVDKLARVSKMGIECGFVDEYSGMADVVVDCTGSPEGLLKAIDLVRPRGVVVVKSLYHDTGRLNLTPIVDKELTCIGSRGGSMRDAIELLSTGAIDVAPLIEAVYPANEIAAAFKRASRRGSLKVLVDFSDVS